MRSSGGGQFDQSSSTSSDHRSGTWASNAIRARTSSPRLVSCVLVAVMANGHCTARIALWLWKFCRLMVGSAGSLPTSSDETSRAVR
ncbi:Uncharacterised protein [Mycobacteroides abscessus subsp. abscessus]|nr:Uncharacterised protein [Mycobacteroides abscessus subsp. abscessus]